MPKKGQQFKLPSLSSEEEPGKHPFEVELTDAGHTAADMQLGDSPRPSVVGGLTPALANQSEIAGKCTRSQLFVLGFCLGLLMGVFAWVGT